MRTLKTLILSLLVGLTISTSAQNVQYEEVISKKTGTIKVNYFENEPLAYSKEGVMSGIEIDILEEFKKWMQENKGVSINYEYQSYSDFDELYTSIKEGKGNTMGVGSVTITSQREAEVDFSAPYLKNVSILITAGAVKTARTEREMNELLSSMKAFTVKGSIHEDHLRKLYSIYKVAPNVSYIKDPMEVFEKISNSSRNLGYVDVITFWKYIRKNDQFVKMHSKANIHDENFGFIFPKNSGWSNEFNEFFESGFGFTSTKTYRKILEKHLSFEILNSVELNP